MASKRGGASVREFAAATRRVVAPAPAPARVETFDHPAEPETAAEPKTRRRGKSAPTEGSES